MRRYVRDDVSGDLYDRETRQFITVIEERHRADCHEIRDAAGDRRTIDHDEIEETR